MPDNIPGLGTADAAGAVLPASQAQAGGMLQTGLDAARWALSEPGQPGGIELPKDPNPPAPVSPYLLSDGTSLANAADYNTPEKLQWAKDKVEAAIAQEKLAEAAAKKEVVRTPGKIYTPDGGVYPNTAFGGAQAWTRQNMGAGAAGFLGGAARAGTNAVAPGLDFALTGLNIARHHLADKTGGGPFQFRAAPEQAAGGGNDIPLVGQSLQEKLGVPGMSADAPMWQRVLEAGGAGYGAGLLKQGASTALRLLPRQGAFPAGAAAGAGVGTAAPTMMPAVDALSPQISAIAKNLGYSTTGELLSKGGELAGNAFGVGDILSYLGGAAGGGMIPFRKGFINTLGPAAAKTADTPAVPAEQGRSADYQRYLERNSPDTSIGDVHDINRAAADQNIPTSFTTLSGPMGQRVAKILGAIMFGGNPIEKANVATEDAIKARVRETAQGVAGPMEIPREGASPGYIGDTLIQGARQAIPNIDAGIARLYDPINRTMRAAGNLDVTSVMNQIRDAIASGRWPTRAREGLEGIAGEFASPGGAPWDLAKRVRRNISQAMGIPDVDTATKEALGGPKAALTDVMRQATERAGLNPGQWDIARNVASAYNRVKGVFNDIAGYRLGNTDQFTPGAKEQTAFNRIDENLQSPSALEPFTHHTYPDLYRRGAFGAYLSRLGLDPNGQFRAEYVAKQLDPQRMDPNVLDILTQRGAAPGEAGGAPTNAGQTFRDLATVGKNTVTPTSRFGLSSTLGVGATLSEALKAVGKTAALPATFLTSRVLESPTMKDAMLGRAAPVANDVFGGMARAGAIENQKRR